jgi:Cu/Ag efflux protein CusF
LVYAQAQSSGQKKADSATTGSAAATSLTSAEVLKVYSKEKKVLLKHAPIPNLGMGAMTMEFGITDPKMLNSVKAGDKVRFAADQVKGQYVVTHIEMAK